MHAQRESIAKREEPVSLNEKDSTSDLDDGTQRETQSFSKLQYPSLISSSGLEEDPRINCLEDRKEAWTTICKSKLLVKVLPHPSDLVLSVLTMERWT